MLSLAERFAPYRGTFRTTFVVFVGIDLFLGGQSHGYPVPDTTIWWAKFSLTAFAVVSLLAFWIDRATFLVGSLIFVPLAIAVRWDDLFSFIERQR